MPLPLAHNFDGDDYKVDELREAISLLQDELDNRDTPLRTVYLGLEDFQVSTADPERRFSEDFMAHVVKSLHAYDPWAVEIIALRRGSSEMIVRYDREFDSNLSFIMKDPS